MFQQHHDQKRHQPVSGLAVASTALITLIAVGTGAVPAAARPDAGAPIARVGHAGGCVLERVVTQYVCGDNNTGNGVPAPAWVPER
ncbi:MAG TPA: hypothetical protein VFL10_14960 [Ornithinibacter sp.]|nr:hypothetical protein [Ornithinibacter sp.]